MQLLTHIATILTEVISLILFIVWFVNTKDIEPFIGIVASSSALFVSIIGKYSVRPRIVLHKKGITRSRSPIAQLKHYPVINLGDKLEHLWELRWRYRLEIRNNSSRAAYNIMINYINVPHNATIEGEIGKIEPLTSHELREFEVKLVQHVTGISDVAEDYMKKNAEILVEKFEIGITYTDETEIEFKTKYRWATDKNKFPFSFKLFSHPDS